MADTRMAQNLNLEEITKYFSDLGYEMIKMEQIWRHVTGILEKAGKKYFLKLASTEVIGERTKNEYQWNLTINNLPKEKQISMRVPNVFEFGLWNNLFWFLSEYVEGPLIVGPQEGRENGKLEPYLELFAKTAKEIIEMNFDKPLPNDDKINSEEKRRVFKERIMVWAKESEVDISSLIDKTMSKIEAVEFAPIHGDFVPWHAINKGKGEIFLVDGEAAKTQGVKFYDVAYFYQRVYTKLKRPDLAGEFLKKFRENYIFSERDKECFYFILGQRIIGGYFDAKNDNVTDMNLQNELMANYLKDSI